MKSMTGFGCASAENTDISVGFRVEMSSVNRKQLEIKVSLPREIAFYETKIRRIVSEKISRGAIFVKVDFQKTDSLSAANSDI